MGGRTVLLGDFHAHSPEWNIHYRERHDVNGLKALIEAHELISNNGPRNVTRLNIGQATSIIDLTFTTTKLRALNF